MSKFKLRIDFEEMPIIKAKGERIEDFDKVIDEIKRKFGGKK
jgi:hypothetical protein